MRLQTAWEWNKELYDNAITILDPDGWRRNDGITMETPITQEDFQERLSHCTCMGFIDNPKFQAANEKQIEAAKKRSEKRNADLKKVREELVDLPQEKKDELLEKAIEVKEKPRRQKKSTRVLKPQKKMVDKPEETE